MNYMEFKAQVVDRIRETEMPGTQVGIHQVPKNNGLVLDGLTILRPGRNISPTVYLEKYYRHFSRGESTIAEITEAILKEHRENDVCGFVDTEHLTDLSRIRNRIYPRLVNYRRNQTFLEDAPHRRFLDLAVIYYFEISEPPLGSATVILRDREAGNWGLREEEIFSLAMENVLRDKPARTIPMIRLLAQLGGEALTAGIEAGQVRSQMQVVTNDERLFGAVGLLMPEVFREISDQMGEDLYILPSSIHEVIVLPVNEGYSRIDLEKMVMEVNETQVIDQEILSDHVYRYSRKEGAVLY